MSKNTTREDWLNAAVSELRPIFTANGFPLPVRIRASCGLPSSRSRSLNRAIGEHWSPKVSDDGTHEIFISPVSDDPVEVFAILVHELSHAATDGQGHQGDFPRCVRSLWLEGKPTATVAGTAFKQAFSALIDSLGAYPHSRLNLSAQHKPQTTRMVKAFCPCCGYTVRLAGKWVAVGLPTCPSDGNIFTL